MGTKTKETPKPTTTPTPETTQEPEIMAEGILTADIAQISRVKDDKKRVQVTLKGTQFKTIEFTTGKEILTNSFSIDSVNFLQMIAESGEQYGSLLNAVCMRERPNAVILALLYNGGKITIERVFKKATDLRENSDQAYGKDLYKTYVRFISATSNPQQLQMAMQIMQNQPIEKDLTASMPMTLTI